ncbi:hypothetical protein IscW_ISCW023754 [Ixodes scapularis]|uniref:Uncharacterized protein n=1 Tax=Ixodes scapularis TaxID=6945 RepID=B7QIM8_IXOSC|nr:hypothetical protein IscW_ISCW023754 [Ixodes scapularis]|eukprot:XP_002415035.1 hypothetical protein IscW_ISCW023754 [Ixodes scapularis]
MMSVASATGVGPVREADEATDAKKATPALGSPLAAVDAAADEGSPRRSIDECSRGACTHVAGEYVRDAGAGRMQACPGGRATPRCRGGDASDCLRRAGAAMDGPIHHGCVGVAGGRRCSLPARSGLAHGCCMLRGNAVGGGGASRAD